MKKLAGEILGLPVAAVYASLALCLAFIVALAGTAKFVVDDAAFCRQKKA